MRLRLGMNRRRRSAFRRVPGSLRSRSEQHPRIRYEYLRLIPYERRAREKPNPFASRRPIRCECRGASRLPFESSRSGIRPQQSRHLHPLRKRRQMATVGRRTARAERVSPSRSVKETREAFHVSRVFLMNGGISNGRWMRYRLEQRIGCWSCTCSRLLEHRPALRCAYDCKTRMRSAIRLR